MEVNLVGRIYEIHVKGLLPSEILGLGDATDSDFARLLESVVDPRKSEAIPEKFREMVTYSFSTQPYMLPYRTGPTPISAPKLTN